LVPLSLVALLLLSGCLGGLGGLGSTDSTSTPEEDDLPPGVNESGVQNASALIAGYNETARKVGIVLTVTENTTTRSYREVRRLDTTLAAGGHPFNTSMQTATYYPDGEPRTEPKFQDIWGNESTTLAQSFWSPPHVVDPSYSFPTDDAPTQAKQYLQYLQLFNYTIDSVVERDGHTFTTLVAGESTEDSTWEARVVVDERGLIHELTYKAQEGDDYEAHWEYRIVETDPEPPEKPDWTANVTEWPPENTTQNGSA
jgi:hypothetical protein